MNKRTAYFFDLDSTITKKEIISSLSKLIGLEEEMSILTELTMNGVIPFKTSFKLRVKLLAALPLTKIIEEIDQIPLGEGIIKFIQKNKDNCFIATGNLDVFIDQLITQKIGCQYFSSKGLVKDAKIFDVIAFIDKSEAIKNMRSQYDFIVAIGDGMNDLGMLKEADIGIAYSGVRVAPKKLIDAATFSILNESELCEKLNQLNKSH